MKIIVRRIVLRLFFIYIIVHGTYSLVQDNRGLDDMFDLKFDIVAVDGKPFQRIPIDIIQSDPLKFDQVK